MNLLDLKAGAELPPLAIGLWIGSSWGGED